MSLSRSAVVKSPLLKKSDFTSVTRISASARKSRASVSSEAVNIFIGWTWLIAMHRSLIMQRMINICASQYLIKIKWSFTIFEDGHPATARSRRRSGGKGALTAHHPVAEFVNHCPARRCDVGRRAGGQACLQGRAGFRESRYAPPPHASVSRKDRG